MLPKKVLVYFLVCKGLSNVDVGMASGTVFQEVSQELVSKPGISLKQSWEGYRRTTRGIELLVVASGIHYIV